MRVGVDTSPLLQTRAGTARHVRGLLGALHERPGLELELLSFGGPGRVASVARDAVWYPHGIGRRARSLDVLHCTTFRGPVRAEVPTVLTVHDLAILRAPEVFPRWHRLYGRAGLKRVLRAASAIVAVSEFSRDETIELVGIPPERIRVIAHGVDPVFTPDGLRADGDYVLAVATLEPRKNLGRAVEAAREAGVELRVVGARGWGGVEVDGWVGEIPDAELAALYRGAACVLYPSLYEGFGLPVLEAMACGTPVVTSVATAMEEVAGGAAVLVDPLDVASIAGGVRRSVRPTRRARCGRARAGKASSRGNGPRTRSSSCGASSRERRRVRRGRPRTTADGRRDVHDQPPARARTARRRGGHSARRDHPPAGPRARRRRALRAGHAVAGAANGVVATPQPSSSRRGSRAHAVRGSVSLPVSRGRLGARRLVRARPQPHGPEGSIRVRARRSPSCTEGGARPHRVRADEGGPGRALRRAGGTHRRHPERRRCRLRSRARGRTITS